MSALLICSCAACGKSPFQSNDTPDNQDKQPSEEIQAPDSEKTETDDWILLTGEDVMWDAFPIPTADVFDLEGANADIFNAIIQIYSNQTYAETYSQSNPPSTDLILPVFEVFDSSTDSDRNVTYYGWFHQYFYYDLGKNLDLNNITYDGPDFKTLGNLTLTSDGSSLSYQVLGDGSDTVAQDIRDLCGPMTELAKYFNGEIDSYNKEPVKVPNLDMEQMVQIYLNHLLHVKFSCKSANKRCVLVCLKNRPRGNPGACFLSM